MLSATLYILSSLLFDSLLKIKQSWIISMNEKPLCSIAFSRIWEVCFMSFALHRAMNVAPLATANISGLNGLFSSPWGFALLTYPFCDVGVGCPVVNENDWLSCNRRVMSALYLNAWMKCAIPSAYIAPSPTKVNTFVFGFPIFIPSPVGSARP